MIAEGDRVVVRAFRMADGLIREVYRNADDLGRLLQLGVTLSQTPVVRSPGVVVLAGHR